jgi:hypothetical protein
MLYTPTFAVPSVQTLCVIDFPIMWRAIETLNFRYFIRRNASINNDIRDTAPPGGQNFRAACVI